MYSNLCIISSLLKKVVYLTKQNTATQGKHCQTMVKLTLIQPGGVNVDLVIFDVKFQTKFLYFGFFFLWPIPAETSSKSFSTSDMTSKNNNLTSILTFFHQKFCHIATLPSSLLLTSFTAITDHLSAREVPPGHGPQCGAVPIKFWSVLGPGPRRVRGRRILSRAGLSLFLSVPINFAAPFWADSRNCSALKMCSKYRERWVYTSWKRGQNRSDPGSLRTSRTQVELGLIEYLLIK